MYLVSWMFNDYKIDYQLQLMDGTIQVHNTVSTVPDINPEKQHLEK